LKQELEFTPPDLVVARLHGILEPEEATRMIAEKTALVGADRMARFLLDMSDLQEVPPRTRIAMLRNPDAYSYSKVAVVGAGGKLRVLGTLILKVLPGVKASAFFDTEAEARSWLEESS